MKRFLFLLMATLVVSLSTVRGFAMSQEESELPGHLTEQQALNLCKWFVTSAPATDGEEKEQRRAAAALILKYATETDKFSLRLDEAPMKLLDVQGGNDQTADLLMVYIAGETIFCLENNLEVSDAASFASAMDGVINFYARMPKHSIKSLNKYLKMDSEKRKAAFEKYYTEKK